MSNGKKNRAGSPAKTVISVVVFVVLVALLVLIVFKHATLDEGSLPVAETDPPAVTETPAETPEPTPEATPEPTPEPTPTPFEPHAVDSTEPGQYILSTAVSVDGERLEGDFEYEDDTGIYFGLGEEYAQIPGVLTFRGNNFRDSAAYGTAQITQKQFGSYWTHATSSLQDPNDGAWWSGNGWTGQPLIAEWPLELRQQMTYMHDWAREQETLVEVIYPAMDGYVYFLELETGKETRDALYMGLTYKGTGTLDPRGYPLLYIGSGYNTQRSHVSIISLIDGSVLYEFGGASENFTLRAWPMYDAAPLIDADTDKLIWAGENGILYIITLGTEYDEEAGTISVNPTRTVKWRYQSERNASSRWYLGFEASPVIWQGYIFMADNSGYLMCMNLDTLELVWVQDILDDSNCTPVLELEDGHPYIYISTSFHLGWRSWTTAQVPVWKIDAETGEIIWQTDFECSSVDGLSGGSQSSIACGKGEAGDLIFVSMSRYPGGDRGTLLALDKSDGHVVWEMPTQVYSWSTPTLVYDQDGHAYLVYCTLGQYMYLIDALTGEQLDAVYCSGKFEASPAIFNNWVVVGHRNGAIWGMEIT